MFKVPPRAQRNVYTVNKFLGVDFTDEPGNVDDNQSPYAENMLRDEPGKMRKSLGWHTVKQFDGRINGSYKRRQDEDRLYHAGTKIWYKDAAVYENANDAPSSAYQLGDKLVIIDGKELLLWDGEKIVSAAQNAYVPTLTIAKKPAGGGADYEALNLLSPKFKELFSGDGQSTEYQLSFEGLDSVELVEILNEDGNWTATDAYTAEPETGTVVFTQAPPKSPVEGEDNVRITAIRTVQGYADRVNKCTFGILYGVSGAADRLFVSGNGEYCNYDWFSGQYDPTYFPDTGYSVLGQSASAIKGYCIIGNYLAAHKDHLDAERNVIVRQGILMDDSASSYPAFPVINSMQGEGAIAPRSFGYLTTEPLFLTRQGVYAITTSDVSGERYTNRRSYFLNGRLLKEENLENAFAVVHNDLYWLFVNGRAYLLDGMQPISTSKDPYTTRQKAGIYRTNVPAVCAWTDGEKLCFGTQDGRICEFYTDRDNVYSYNDDGKAIYCCYVTPDFSGNQFFRNKTFRYLAAKLSRFIRTGVDMFINDKGVWTKVYENNSGARYFSFEMLAFSDVTFDPNASTATLNTKTRLKRVDKTAYKFENSRNNEPFGLMEYAIEYEEKGYYKG